MGLLGIIAKSGCILYVFIHYPPSFPTLFTPQLNPAVGIGWYGHGFAVCGFGGGNVACAIGVIFGVGVGFLTFFCIEFVHTHTACQGKYDDDKYAHTVHKSPPKVAIKTPILTNFCNNATPTPPFCYKIRTKNTLLFHESTQKKALPPQRTHSHHHRRH